MSLISPLPVLVTALAPERSGDRWAASRWLATPDERVLWAILAATALLAAWGAWVGWRRAR